MAHETHGAVGPVKVVEDTPSSVGLMVRAALPALPGVNALPGVRRTGSTLPDLELVRRGVAVDRSHVDAYAAVCGFPAKDTLPLPYLHMLAFPLHMSVMTDPSFPFPAMGTVHLENVITRHRPTTDRDRYDVSVRAANLRSHAKGKAFDLLTQVKVDDEVVWEEVSTYLRRGKGDESAPAGLDVPMVDDGGVEWRLPADLGRRYAAVSGDRNPIHTSNLAAKAFGFPRAIAHGMYTAARALAAVGPAHGESFAWDVEFAKPVLLPSTVAVRVAPDASPAHTGTALGAGFSYVVWSPKNARLHLSGSVRPL